MAMGITEIRFQQASVLPHSVAVSARALLQRCRRCARRVSMGAAHQVRIPPACSPACTLSAPAYGITRSSVSALIF
eukprot:3875039-Pleurochrysis_carterae.AAC.1